MLLAKYFNALHGVVNRPSGSLGKPTVAIVGPILEFPRGQGTNGSGSQKSEAL